MLSSHAVVVEYAFGDTIALEEPQGFGERLRRDALDRLRQLKMTPRSEHELSDDTNDPLSAEYRRSFLG